MYHHHILLIISNKCQHIFLISKPSIQVQISTHIIIFLYIYHASSISLALLVAFGPILLKGSLAEYSVV